MHSVHLRKHNCLRAPLYTLFNVKHPERAGTHPQASELPARTLNPQHANHFCTRPLTEDDPNEATSQRSTTPLPASEGQKCWYRCQASGIKVVQKVVVAMVAVKVMRKGNETMYVQVFCGIFPSLTTFAGTSMGTAFESLPNAPGTTAIIMRTMKQSRPQTYYLLYTHVMVT